MYTGHFFLQFLHIAGISQRVHNSRTLILFGPCISQILTTFNLCSGKAEILRGGGNPPTPPLGQVYVSGNGLQGPINSKGITKASS